MGQLRAIRILLAVARAASFSAAARALDLAPSVVTREVMELERELGARLLQRTTRRVWLTPAGEIYVARMRDLISGIDNANNEVRAAAHGVEGRLRVAAPVDVARSVLLPASVAFRRDHPQTTVQLIDSRVGTQPDERADLSLLLCPLGALKGDFVARQLAVVHLGLYAAPRYLSEHGRPVHPRDLALRDILAAESTPMPVPLRLVRAACDPPELEVVNLRPAPIASTDTGTLIDAALLGVGLLGMPSFAACALVHSQAFEAVLPGWQAEPLGLYAGYRAPHQLPRGARLFLESLQHQLGASDADPWLDGWGPGDRCGACARDCAMRLTAPDARDGSRPKGSPTTPRKT